MHYFTWKLEFVSNIFSMIVVLEKNDYFLHQKFKLHRQQMNGFLYWRSFYRKKLGPYISHDLIAWLIATWIWYYPLTVRRFWPFNHYLSYFIYLWWCYCVLKYRNNESRSKQLVDFYLQWMKHLLNKFFWINETNIYTTTWWSRCSQLHRLTRLNPSARRYILWRQIWYICVTAVIFWIFLRFRDVEIKYLRKISICIPKYTA